MLKLGVGIFDAVESVVIVGEPLAGDIQSEIVSRAAHASLALSRGRPVGRGARNQRGELEIIAAVER